MHITTRPTVICHWQSQWSSHIYSWPKLWQFRYMMFSQGNSFTVQHFDKKHLQRTTNNAEKCKKCDFNTFSIADILQGQRFHLPFCTPANPKVYLCQVWNKSIQQLWRKKLIWGWAWWLLITALKILEKNLKVSFHF